MYILVKHIKQLQRNFSFKFLNLVLADHYTVHNGVVGNDYSTDFILTGRNSPPHVIPIVYRDISDAEETKYFHQCANNAKYDPYGYYKIYPIKDYLEEATMNLLGGKKEYYQLTEALLKIAEKGHDVCKFTVEHDLRCEVKYSVFPTTDCRERDGVKYTVEHKTRNVYIPEETGLHQSPEIKGMSITVEHIEIDVGSNIDSMEHPIGTNKRG